VDGTLDDAEWLRSVRLSDLHEVWPHEFAPASERTDWFLSYDDRHLYVAAHALNEDPEQIVAQTLHQGALIRSDDIGINTRFHSTQTTAAVKLRFTFRY